MIRRNDGTVTGRRANRSTAITPTQTKAVALARKLSEDDDDYRAALAARARDDGTRLPMAEVHRRIK